MSSLTVRGLSAGIDSKSILSGLDLSVQDGEIHALMGPNGHGKSTLANVLMGHPRYAVEAGEAFLDDAALFDLEVSERARRGLFLAFQYPAEIPGVTVAKFLKRAADLRREPPKNAGAFLAELKANLAFLNIDPSFVNRYLNDGFSGGEKKRMEVLQMLMLRPGMVILDETDSGLDIDALRVVASGVNSLRSPERSMLVITHYQRLLNYIAPDVIHVLSEGRIVRTGDKSLALLLEEKGYGWLEEEAPVGAGKAS